MESFGKSLSSPTLKCFPFICLENYRISQIIRFRLRFIQVCRCVTVYGRVGVGWGGGGGSAALSEDRSIKIVKSKIYVSHCIA
jgi:hypothetical protein